MSSCAPAKIASEHGKLRPVQNTHRLSAIEGLRGFLAIYVLLTHAVQASGFTQESVFGFLGNFDAVKCFMMVSGFVIFYLLDTKQESYSRFITRRFLRIFPVYFLIFLLSIPCALVSEKLFESIHTTQPQFFCTLGVFDPIYKFQDLIKNLHWHVLWHSILLHGILPDSVLKGSATAFLGPAWSLSLEWQFYLIAPILFRAITSPSTLKKGIMYSACFAMLLLSKRFIPHIAMDAALPFQIENFFAGIAAYFVYRSLKDHSIKEDSIFPAVLFLGVAVYKLADKSALVLPPVLWVCVIALLLEPPSSFSRRCIEPILTNRISLWLGKISYSVYISHAIVLIWAKWTLISFFPKLTAVHQLLTLGIITLGLTIGISAVLYQFIERPFIDLGRRLKER